jgi:hypothetical protein
MSQIAETDSYYVIRADCVLNSNLLIFALKI